MIGYSFSERVRKVLMMAREEAERLHHEYVGTEHMLLALIREGEGVGVAALQNLKIDLAGVTRIIEETVKEGKTAKAPGTDLPYTTRAKKVLELAMESARDLGHNYVSTEHLLLGLIREAKGIAAQVLTHVGATLDAVREETVRLLGSTELQAVRRAGSTRTGAAGGAARTAPTAGTTAVTNVTVEIRRDDGSVTRESFPGVLSAIGFLSRQA